MAEAWQLQWSTNKDTQPTSNIGASDLTINAVNNSGQTQLPATAQPAAQKTTTPPTTATTAPVQTQTVQTAQTQQVKQKTSLPVFVERQASMKLDKYVTDLSLFDAFLNKDIGQNELTYLKETDPARYKALQTYTQWAEAKAKITAYRDNLQEATKIEVVDATPVSPYQKSIDDLTTKSQEFYDAQIKEVSALSTTYSAQDIYNSTVNTKELEAKQEAMIDAKAEVEKYNDMIKNLENDVRGRYPWASESFIARMVAREAKDITALQDTALTKYNTALSDYQATQENSQTQFKLALDDAQRQEDLQRKQLEQKMNITKDAFTRDREVTTLQINKLLQDEQFAKEQQLKEYWFNKDLESKVYLSQLDQDQQKAMMEYETQLKLNYYNSTKDHNVSYQEIDGRTYMMDENGEVVGEFNPNVVGFNFDMQIKRTWTNVGKDTNNPWNITADWFKTQEAKANYWAKIGAIGTYTSPNGREYYVFSSLEDWARAQREFMQRAVSWQSAQYSSGMTLDQFVKTYTWSANTDYANKVASYVGWSVSTPLWSIDYNKLAEAISLADSGVNISWHWFSERPEYVDQSAYNPNLAASYTKYMENGIAPNKADLESLWWLEAFGKAATAFYIENKTRAFSKLWFDLVDPNLLIASTPSDRKDLTTDLNNLVKYKNVFDEMIKDIEESGLPKQNITGRWRLLKQKARELQIFAKGEKQFNLWVLNWPDMSILEDFLPTPWSVNATLAWKDTVLKQLEQARDSFINEVNRVNEYLGLSMKSDMSWGNAKVDWDANYLDSIVWVWNIYQGIY